MSKDKNIIEYIESNKKLFEEHDPKECAIGIQVEMEHTDNPATAFKIAQVHMDENKNYYAKLSNAGLVDENLTLTDKIISILEEKPMKKATEILRETLAKAGGERAMHKYYKRVPKKTGKGFDYFYSQSEYEHYLKTGEKPAQKEHDENIEAVPSFVITSEHNEGKTHVDLSVAQKEAEKLKGIYFVKFRDMREMSIDAESLLGMKSVGKLYKYIKRSVKLSDRVKEESETMKKAVDVLKDTLLKAGGERAGHKYYKRVPKKTGKGWNYFYNKAEWDHYKKTGEVPGEKKHGAIVSAIMSFFGIKDKARLKDKIKAEYSKHKDQLAAVPFSMFKDHLTEYFEHKDKWDKKIAGGGERGKSTGGAKKPAGKPKSTGGGAGPHYSLKIMRTIAEIYGGGAKKEEEATGKKTYDIQYNVGHAKYIVSFHDGKKVNRDGSPADDMRIFKNKDDLGAFLKDLSSQGYAKRGVGQEPKKEEPPKETAKEPKAGGYEGSKLYKNIEKTDSPEHLEHQKDAIEASITMLEYGNDTAKQAFYKQALDHVNKRIEQVKGGAKEETKSATAYLKETLDKKEGAKPKKITAGKLMDIDIQAMDALNAESGGEVQEAEDKSKAYVKFVFDKLDKMGITTLSQKVFDRLEDRNYHTLNATLTAGGYFGEKEKKDQEDFAAQMKRDGKDYSYGNIITSANELKGKGEKSETKSPDNFETMPEGKEKPMTSHERMISEMFTGIDTEKAVRKGHWDGLMKIAHHQGYKGTMDELKKDILFLNKERKRFGKSLKKAVDDLRGTLFKAGSEGERPGHKYVKRVKQGGKWIYYYGGEGKEKGEGEKEPEKKGKKPEKEPEKDEHPIKKKNREILKTALKSIADTLAAALKGGETTPVAAEGVEKTSEEAKRIKEQKEAEEKAKKKKPENKDDESKQDGKK